MQPSSRESLARTGQMVEIATHPSCGAALPRGQIRRPNTAGHSESLPSFKPHRQGATGEWYYCSTTDGDGLDAGAHVETHRDDLAHRAGARGLPGRRAAFRCPGSRHGPRKARHRRARPQVSFQAAVDQIEDGCGSGDTSRPPSDKLLAYVYKDVSALFSGEFPRLVTHFPVENILLSLQHSADVIATDACTSHTHCIRVKFF